MDATHSSASAPEAAGKRRIPVGYIIAAVIVAVIVLAFLGMHLYFRLQINAERDAIRKAGFPVTLRELSVYYPVPQGNNAAVVYTQAFAKYAGHNMENKLPLVSNSYNVKLPPRGEPLPEDMKTDISAYLAANAEALEFLHKAAAIDGCRFDLDFSQGYGMPLPHLGKLRQATQLLELQALMKVEGGKPDDAAMAIADSFGAARALQNEPVLISQLMRLGVISISVSNLERVLSRSTLGDQQLTDLSNAIASQENPEALIRGLAGERCTGEDLFLNNLSRYIGPVTKPGNALTLWQLSGLKAMDHLKYLQLMAELVRTAGGSARDILDTAEDWEKKVHQLPRLYFLTNFLVPALTRVNEEQLKIFARLRSGRAAIAVERFRMANGRLPGSLDELTPKWLDTVPADPFDDQPIRYKKLAKGFVTYSVGPDQKDHGGIELDPKHYNIPHDITFIVAR
jgi:hypothetical protein